MRELRYVSVPSGGKSYCYFPYYCSTNTSIVFENLYLPIQDRTGGGTTFFAEGPGRFQGYGNGMMCGVPNIVDDPKNLSYEFWEGSIFSNLFRVQYLMTGAIDGKLEVGNAYMKLNDATIATSTPYTGTNITLTEQFHLFDHWYKGWSNWIKEGHCGTVSFYENGTLAARFIPYEDDNGVAGFYDEKNQTMIYSMVDPWVAGPDASSIVAEPSKRTLAATGETINIVVTCENAWTVTGETFLTLSSTGDTGSTTITATAPDYSTGTTARTDTLTFTDTVTGDEWEIAIRQKKYTDGQPVYLGANEVSEAYLGAIEITEAYLGDVLVFSASVPAPTPTPGGDITITIDGADACVGGDPMMGDCLNVSAYTYSIVSVDPNDGETELETFASATIENAMYGEGVRFEITDSATTSGITSITLDDSDGIKLTIVGEFDSANTYAVKCSTVGIDDGITRYGYAMGGNSNNYFNLSEDISVTPDFYNELMPLRTLTIENIPNVPDEATHIEVTDDDKFGIDITWDGSDASKSVWTGDEGSGDRITVTYDDTEQTITIAADWDDYGGEGSGEGEYNLHMKAETDSCTVLDGDEGTYSLQWSANELTKTITFSGGTCTPSE